MKNKKEQLKNGEVVTPLGTFSEAIAERKRQWKLYTLFTILCVLLIFITGGLCYLIF